MLKIHKPKCENIDITTTRTSPESHLHWKKHFHKNSIQLEYMQVSKLIMKKITLVKVIKHLIFINNTQY